MTTLIRSAYDGKRKSVAISFIDPKTNEPMRGKTIQSAKNECDINRICKKFDKDGLVTHVNKGVAQYGDFSEINEFQESLDFVLKAKQSFAEIPSDIRKEFDNDPGKFFEFATNPKNNEKMVEMGLAIAIEPDEPITVKILETEEKESETS